MKQVNNTKNGGVMCYKVLLVIMLCAGGIVEPADRNKYTSQPNVSHYNVPKKMNSFWQTFLAFAQLYIKSR